MSIDIVEFEEGNYESAEQAYTDWSILDEEGVTGIAERAAKSMADQYSQTLEYEDAYQEALIFLATRPQRARQALTKGPGALNNWIRQRIRDKFLDEQVDRSDTVSWDENQERLAGKDD
ncbi:hypothetical protein PQC18_gp45 [Streptomyces phage Pablito]|uniref:Uncharacterized protein n=1 Tax=Streptomyces phage Pablito TaxID=2894593 RepID=A0AAE8YHC5_9CAUD|nr:hypothetical protein PQC18_gp45 [Streptomyces phage Pablito]UFD97983.1 hypothetical protein [Streptomyces phage Pablito]